MNRLNRKGKGIQMLGIILLGILFSLFQSNLNDALGISEEKSIENNPADSVDFKTYATESTANLATTNMNVLGQRLWFGGAETGNLSEWSGNPQMNSQNVLFSGSSADRALSGSRSFKLQADMGGKMASTQLYVWGANGIPTNNPDAIYTAWFFIPEKIDMTGVSWYNIFQWKARISDGSSRKTAIVHIEVRGGKGSGGNNYLQLYWTDWSSGSSRDNRIPALSQVDIPIGKWFKIQARYWHSTSGNNGRIMMWQDDVLIFDQQNIPTYPNTIRGLPTTELQWSVNNYGQNTIPSVTTVYIDDASIHLPGEQQEIPTYTLSLQRNPSSGGTLENLTGGSSYKQGDQVKLRATPNSGFAFLNWSRNGQVISTNPEFTFTMPGSNVTLVANFEAVTTEPTTTSLQLGASPSNGGKVRIKTRSN
ncbi:InlB B-repeat-containing protein [Shivajiella indica]|uniref:Heparin lyase I family protein n=1 Tax=Shivajiella indica TaxID=872115 RepID=A0ABW5BB08_9BACT